MSEESTKPIWDRLNQLTDRVAQADKTAAMTANGLSRHLDECERQHKENRLDRAETRREMREGFDELKTQVAELQKQGTLNTNIVKAIDDLKTPVQPNDGDGVVVPVKWLLWLVAAMLMVVAAMAGVKALPGVPLILQEESDKP